MVRDRVRPLRFSVLEAPWVRVPVPVNVVATVMVHYWSAFRWPVTVVVGAVSVPLLISAPPVFTRRCSSGQRAAIVILPEIAKGCDGHGSGPNRLWSCPCR